MNEERIIRIARRIFIAKEICTRFMAKVNLSKRNCEITMEIDQSRIHCFGTASEYRELIKGYNDTVLQKAMEIIAMATKSGYSMRMLENETKIYCLNDGVMHVTAILSYPAGIVDPFSTPDSQVVSGWLKAAGFRSIHVIDRSSY